MKLRVSVIVLMLMVLFLFEGISSKDRDSKIYQEEDSTFDQQCPDRISINLIAEVTFADGNVVEFFEPWPGMIVISEYGKISNYPLDAKFDIRGLTPVEIYQRITSAAIPQELIEAQERYNLIRNTPLLKSLFTPRPEKQKMGKDATLSDEQSIFTVNKDTVSDVSNVVSSDNKQWFIENYCNKPSSWSICWTNRTGTSSFTRSDVECARLAVWSYRGQITYRIRYRPWWTWSTLTNRDISEGYGYTAWLSNFVDFDVESKVYNASGDGYHHAGYGIRK